MVAGPDKVIVSDEWIAVFASNLHSQLLSTYSIQRIYIAVGRIFHSPIINSQYRIHDPIERDGISMNSHREKRITE